MRGYLNTGCAAVRQTEEHTEVPTDPPSETPSLPETDTGALFDAYVNI